MKIRDLIESTKEHGIGMILCIQYSNYLDCEVEEVLDSIDTTDNKEWFWIPFKVRLDYYKKRELDIFSKRIKEVK